MNTLRTLLTSILILTCIVGCGDNELDRLVSSYSSSHQFAACEVYTQDALGNITLRCFKDIVMHDKTYSEVGITFAKVQLQVPTLKEIGE